MWTKTYVDSGSTLSFKYVCQKCDTTLKQIPCPSLMHDFDLEGPNISKPNGLGCGCYSPLNDNDGVYYIGVCKKCNLNTPPIIVQDYYSYQLHTDKNGEPSKFSKLMHTMFKDKHPDRDLPTMDLYGIAQNKLKEIILGSD